MTEEEKTIIHDAISLSFKRQLGVLTFVQPNGSMQTNYVPFRTHDWEDGFTQEHRSYALQCWHDETEKIYANCRQ